LRTGEKLQKVQRNLKLEKALKTGEKLQKDH
jgi:hypothetical protein